eukprot:8636622-Pyramimonas_sp.AAC.1
MPTQRGHRPGGTPWILPVRVAPEEGVLRPVHARRRTRAWSDVPLRPPPGGGHRGLRWGHRGAQPELLRPPPVADNAAHLNKQ